MTSGKNKKGSGRGEERRLDIRPETDGREETGCRAYMAVWLWGSST